MRSIWVLLGAGLAACTTVKGDGEEDTNTGIDDEQVEPDTAADDTGMDTAVDDTGPDTAIDTGGETGDTADTAVEPAWGDCAMLNQPWEFEDGDDLMSAHQWLWPDIGGIELLLTQAVALGEEGCPDYTASETGSSFVLDGDCTTSDGVRYQGRVTVMTEGSVSSWSRETAFEDFHFWPEEGEHFWADGLLTLSGTNEAPESGIPEEMTIDANVRHGAETMGGMDMDNGEWARRMAFTVIGENGFRMTDGYIWVIRGEDAMDKVGDWCESIEIVDSPSCADEGDGFIRATANGSVTLTLDGSTACDTCGVVSGEGMATTPYCPDWGTTEDTGVVTP